MKNAEIILLLRGCPPSRLNIKFFCIFNYGNLWRWLNCFLPFLSSPLVAYQVAHFQVKVLGNNSIFGIKKSKHLGDCFFLLLLGFRNIWVNTAILRGVCSYFI